MANEHVVDISKYVAGNRTQNGGRSETETVSHILHPERGTRPQSEKERSPDYYDRQKAEAHKHSERSR
jgi:hypothetical protein